jgi:hypothetical protein
MEAMKLKPSEILIAGPYVGEFGFRLMTWQGYVRRQASRYRYVVVCDRADYECLYSDFAHEFIPHDITGQPYVYWNVEGDAKFQADDLNLQLNKRIGKRLRPSFIPPVDKQKFIRYGDPDRAAARGEVFDLLLHARQRDWDESKNMPREWWDQLIRRIYHERPCGMPARPRIGAIGSKRLDYCPKGVVDLRDRPLQDTMDTLHASRAIIGTSSGPMHLAGLCGTPRLIWSGRLYYGGLEGRDQDIYMRKWNPIHSSTIVLDFRRTATLYSIDDVWRGLMGILNPKFREELEIMCSSPWFNQAG